MAKTELPKIVFDGEKLDDLLLKCNTIKITKSVESPDIVDLKLFYHDVILLDPVNTNIVYIELNGKKYTLTKIEGV